MFSFFPRSHQMFLGSIPSNSVRWCSSGEDKKTKQATEYLKPSKDFFWRQSLQDSKVGRDIITASGLARIFTGPYIKISGGAFFSLCSVPLYTASMIQILRCVAALMIG